MIFNQKKLGILKEYYGVDFKGLEFFVVLKMYENNYIKIFGDIKKK